MSPELIVVLVACLVAVPSALVGSFLVLRRMAMVSDAISHSVLLGIVVVFFVTGSKDIVPMLIGATITGSLTAALSEAIHRSGRLKEDASIGVVFPALFALGVVGISRLPPTVHLDLDAVLYGEIAYAPWSTMTLFGAEVNRPLVLLGTVGLLVTVVVVLLYQSLKITTFDPQLAALLGFQPLLVQYLLTGLVSLTAVSAFESVGAVLVVALMIIPPATAYLLTDRLPVMLMLAVVTGIGSAVCGYLLASFFDASIAGAMATVAGLFFLAALVLSPRGVFRHRVRPGVAATPPSV